MFRFSKGFFVTLFIVYAISGIISGCHRNTGTTAKSSTRKTQSSATKAATAKISGTKAQSTTQQGSIHGQIYENIQDNSEDDEQEPADDPDKDLDGSQKEVVDPVGSEVIFYVDNRGNDNNDGTISKPFATIMRAQKEVRKIIEQGQTCNITVWIRGGLYNIESPILFSTEDSGNDEFSITYAAYNNEIPVISGGKTITNWEKEGNIWRADVPNIENSPWVFSHLFKDEARLTRARFPNQGFLDLQYAAQDEKEVILKQEVKTVAKPDKVEFVVQYNWSTARAMIKNLNNGVITLYSQAGFPGSKWQSMNGEWTKPRVYLENSLSFLDSPGEWYLDIENNKLYYMGEENENPNDSVFTAPVLNKLVMFQGNNNELINNIIIKGLTFAYTNWNLDEKGYRGTQAAYYRQGITNSPVYALPVAIELRYVKGIIFEQCTIKHTGASGIGLGISSHGNQFIGNRIYDIGGNGIMVGWRDNDQMQNPMMFDSDWRDLWNNSQPTGNVVSNNHIHHTGAVIPDSVSIFAAFSENTTISNNLIHDTPYTGISVGLIWKPVPTSQRGCIIENNHIYNVLTQLADGGGIYTLGYQPGTVIRRNLIHSIQRSPYASGAELNGIYLDDGSKDISLEENIVYDMRNRYDRYGQPINEYEGLFLSKLKHPEEWYVFKNNYFGVSPEDPSFPKEIAEQAGLNQYYKNLIK